MNVTPFIPQPHTPMQWAERPDTREMNRRLKLVKKSLPRKVKFKAEDARVSTLEAALARGGEELGPIILHAYLNGARLDGWSEHFDYDVWVKAFEKFGLDLEQYACRSMTLGDDLPWANIDVGLSAEFLEEEFRRVFAGETTPNCLDDECSQCGVCAGEVYNRRAGPSQPELPNEKARDVTKKAMRVRFNYAKEGIYRFLSHLDLYRQIRMALARAGWPVACSRGYSPKPRIELAPPLPLGVVGEREWADVYLHSDTDLETLLRRLEEESAEFAPGDIGEIDVKAPSFFKSVSAADWYAETWPLSELTEVSGEDVLKAIRAKITEGDYRYTNRKGQRDAAGKVDNADVAAGVFFWRTLISDDGAIVNPYDLLAGLGGVSPSLARLIPV
ncbi:MAG: DUF2344 domain-containing protein, partial [bacterium]|nr:DUF2344 domain-containing protein [bacterium]